jgi:hypothetical protein
MPGKYIYVIENGAPDYSRWLHITLRADRACMVHLSDLCHPGKLSSLTTIATDLDSLRSCGEHGAMQITLPMGYCVMRRDDNLIQIEFRGHDDDAPCRVAVGAEAFLKRIDELDRQATEATTAPLAG